MCPVRPRPGCARDVVHDRPRTAQGRRCRHRWESVSPFAVRLPTGSARVRRWVLRAATFAVALCALASTTRARHGALRCRAARLQRRGVSFRRRPRRCGHHRRGRQVRRTGPFRRRDASRRVGGGPCPGRGLLWHRESPAAPEQPVLTKAGDRHTANVTFPATGGVLRGTVAVRGGRSTEGARLTTMPVGAGGPTVAHAGTDGAYEMAVPAGAQHLRVSSRLGVERFWPGMPLWWGPDATPPLRVADGQQVDLTNTGDDDVQMSSRRPSRGAPGDGRRPTHAAERPRPTRPRTPAQASPAPADHRGMERRRDASAGVERP